MRHFHTTTDTLWHKPGQGYFVIPEGTVGHMVMDLRTAVPDPEEQKAFRRIVLRKRREGVRVYIVYLAGKVRCIEEHFLQFDAPGEVSFHSSPMLGDQAKSNTPEEETTMAIIFEATESTLLDEGYYPATLQKIEERQGNNGPYLKWDFRIRHEGQDITVGGVTSTRFGPKAKARQWTEALYRSLDNGEKIDLEALCGTKCRVQVVSVTLSDGGEVNRVEKVLPRKESKVALAQSQEADDIPF